MPRPKPINRDNEDLIGLTYRRNGSVSRGVVVEVDAETEGLLHVASCLSGLASTADAIYVRNNLVGETE